MARIRPLALLVMGPGDARTVLVSEGQVIAVGRAAECDVRIDDSKLSRRHAEIRIGSKIEVVDLGSLNGTVVRDARIDASAVVEVAIGEPITIGDTLLVVQRRLDSAAPPDAHVEQSPRAPGAVLHVGAIERMDPVTRRVAAGSINVLVLGETGVGKEILARRIHDLSPRAGVPMLAINCAAISESLLESELFGHEKGAFTGAVSDKVGLLESAKGGTVFLDEVGEMPLVLQAKMLRVLEQREVLRVGGVRPRPIDVRFIAATNRDLEVEAAAGRFRQDLYFRLNGIALSLSPLRERVDEIEPLARAFLDACPHAAGRGVLDISPDALEALQRHSWPGNIRELRNVIERAALLCTGRRIGLEHLRMERPARPATAVEAPRATPSWSNDEERKRVVDALDRCAWNQSEAAKLLGVSRGTLIKRLEEFGLRRPRKPA